MSNKVSSPVLDEKNKQQVEIPDYSQEERDYLSGLQTRLERARNAREDTHDEFDGMTYSQYYDVNNRAANTIIPPKQNREDSNYSSGAVREKLFAILSALINLDLAGDISALDSNELLVAQLGDAMEDIVLKCKQLDGDDEKQMVRWYELLKQGDVFVESIWSEEEIKEKKMDVEFTGKIADAKWNERMKKAIGKPVRNVIPGVNVYMGNIAEYEFSRQPYIFTVDIVPYEEAKATYGNWERWKFVSKTIKRIASENNAQSSMLSNNWRLTEVQENTCEIIKYQDKWNNEFGVIINGVLMTPVGLPFPWGYGEYSIDQQHLEPFHANFAYGNSYVRRIKNLVALHDELVKLAVLKTQKSFAPTYLNISGRVLSRKIFMPGTILNGIAPGTVVPLSDKETQGVTSSEFSMIQDIRNNINSLTTSPTFSGQSAAGNPTATEIVELQRQAKLMLGLMVFAVSMLEWKLEWKTLYLVLKFWFNSQNEIVDEVRNELREVYRNVSVERPIADKGMGRRIIVPTKTIPPPEAIAKAEESLSQEQGTPVQLIFLNPEEVTSSKLIWQIVIRPKEKRTSETQKLLFRAFMQDAMIFQQDLNMSELENEFALAWGKDPSKLFKPQQSPMMPPMGSEAGSPALSPRIKLPTAEKAMGNQINKSLQTQ